MKKEWVWVSLALAVITGIFFYQTFLRGLVPFPGDGLVSDFQPWRSSSYLGFAPGGVPNKAQYPDVYRQMYPWRSLAIRELKSGKLPLWNPYNFSGAPLLANFQSAALYPLNIIFLFVNEISGWSILVILQPLLASLFMYLYMRKLKTAPYGAALAAISYGFSGFMAVWLEYNTVGHVILWLPLIFYAIERVNGKGPAIWFCIIAVSNAFALLAGHPQIYSYMLIASVLYAWFRTTKTKFLLILAFSFIGVCITGPQLVPGIELIMHAARSPHDFTNLFTKILVQPWQLLGLPFPNLFGNPETRTYWPSDTFVGKVLTVGLVPLFFSLSALRRKDSITNLFLWASVGIIVLITANPFTYLLYQIPIPLITSSSPTLMSFLLVFSLSAVCGLGFDHWITEKHTVKKLVHRSLEVVAILALLFIGTKIPAFGEYALHAQTAFRALVYAAAISGATLLLFWTFISFPKLRTVAVIGMLCLHAADLFIFFIRFNPFVPPALVFPGHEVLSFLVSHGPDRYWGYGTADIAANFATQYGMFSPEGYDPLYPKSYGEFLYSYKNGKLATAFDNATRSDAAITSHFGDGGLTDPNKQRVLNDLSVRYILDRTENNSTAETLPPGVFRPLISFGDWRIYENRNAKPRVYLTNGTAVIKTYKPERVVIQTNAPAPDTLIVTDTYYPGWKATIDGAPSDIVPKDHALRSLAVPAGTHTVVMTYAPLSVTIGFVLSMIGITGMALGAIGITRRYA